jgi:hypothetical protein
MSRATRIRIPAVLTGFVLLLCMTGQAVSARLYDVEVIVFSNQAGVNDGEQMSTPAVDAVRPAGVFPENRFTELAPGFYTMGNIRGGLSAASGYNVLFHRAWRQQAYDRAHAVDYPVHSFADNGRDSIEGTIRLIKERYLHLDMDLLLMAADSGSPVLYSDGPGSVPAFRLSEKRRVRSHEIHYFDHPNFGVIARVTPYNPPEEPAVVVPVEEITVEDGQAAGDEATAIVPADDQLTR